MRGWALFFAILVCCFCFAPPVSSPSSKAEACGLLRAIGSRIAARRAYRANNSGAACSQRFVQRACSK